MQKIGISEGAIADLSWAEPAAKELGLEIHVVSIATPEDVAKNLVGMDALVVSLQKVNAEVIAALPNSVKCVGRLGVGLDNIDLEAAKKNKLPVIFQPTYAYNEVANHAIAMIMSLHRGLMTASDGEELGVDTGSKSCKGSFASGFNIRSSWVRSYWSITH